MKPKICLISDVPGWAFDQNNHDLAEYLSDVFDFSHFYVAGFREGLPNWDNYNAIFELYHRNPGMGLPYHKTAGALRSEWFYPEHPGSPTANDIALVNRYAMFQVAVERNYNELISRCPNVVYLTNPINMRRFATATPLRNDIVAEWNGNSAHAAQGRRIKHFHDIIIPACQQAGVGLVSAEYNTIHGDGRRRSREEMPQFYLQANVALCASEFEAASNSILESMASGLAVIATDVGNHREMRDSQIANYGDTGIILVEGNVGAFVAALQGLTPVRAYEMGQINRAEISERWSWDVWAQRYENFLWKTINSQKEKSASVTNRVPSPKNDVVDFTYWNNVDPNTFIADDWENPARSWAGQVVKESIKRGCRNMVEVGPGVGTDYERQFKKPVLAGELFYEGVEGSSSFCELLRSKHPESKWTNSPLAELPSHTYDIVYTRAVLEHQPALEPSLSILLRAAKRQVIIAWYRPPAAEAIKEVVNNIYYHTFQRDEVLSIITREGWKLVEEAPFDSGNLGWVLERA